MTALMIEDENGNPHGPFATKEDGIKYAEDRGLGDQRRPDDETGTGWCWCMPAR